MQNPGGLWGMEGNMTLYVGRSNGGKGVESFAPGVKEI